MNENLFDVIETIAENFDGHFTIMGFTTGTRVSFGTPNSKEEIASMSFGHDISEALISEIKKLTIQYSEDKNDK